MVGLSGDGIGKRCSRGDPRPQENLLVFSTQSPDSEPHDKPLALPAERRSNRLALTSPSPSPSRDRAKAAEALFLVLEAHLPGARLAEPSNRPETGPARASSSSRPAICSRPERRRAAIVRAIIVRTRSFT